MKKKIVVLMMCCMMLGIGACGSPADKGEAIGGEPISANESYNEGVSDNQNQAANDGQTANDDQAANDGQSANDDQSAKDGQNANDNQAANDGQDQTGRENDNVIPDGNKAQAGESIVSGQKVQEFFANGVVASDYDRDHTADIQASIDAIAASSASIQEELKAVAKIAEQFNKLMEAANTQYELNKAAGWGYDIWDKELNSLWNRISSQADAQTKEKLLSEQRKWVSMKEEVTGEYLGSREENGSMYPMLQYGFWETITRNRVYVLANALAKIKGESFDMPERDGKYSICVDDQGTDSVYSSLSTLQSPEGKDIAIISLYRTGQISGTVEDQGNGKLAFTSYDKHVQGIILLKGWQGASFEVTAVEGESIVNVGDMYDFDFAF